MGGIHTQPPCDASQEVRASASHRGTPVLPFGPDDVTAGTENELQAAVAGSPDHVDLAVTIETSNYFKNIIKRAAAGESPRKVVTQLEEFVRRSGHAVWEHSWVRFPRRRLGAFARRVFERDLLADRTRLGGRRRQDSSRFQFSREGEDWLRIPISYLLKLALADATGSGPDMPPSLRALGKRLMGHFLNDNSSPETHSFYVVRLSPAGGMGRAVAAETALRYFLTQLLAQYANERFGLREAGQQALVYLAPHPPVRLKELNTLVSDTFYRELFMNPCLSGWTDGEAKARYMHLCHQVLSRSQVNAVIKLKEAGIITRNLVVLPSASNISLANNGTHLSLGSRLLTGLLKDPSSGFGPAQEKRAGDLVIKIVEHFLPLFVGTYTAAPYRLDYSEFHPEKALGFLPHELDLTHLRMIWRRWKKKAGLRIFGQPVTPMGPVWVDRLISRVFSLKGDFVPDFRLIDYLVALLSTDQSPALDGELGNERRLRQDLAQLGVFDESMSLYLLYKLRSCAAMGFSGFEGRHYSLFDSLLDDLGEAATLQTLVTALAYRYVADGTVTHADIPDDPSTESERRQFIFGAAIGVPALNVRQETSNRFLLKVLSRTTRSRESRRYPGYLRVRAQEFRLALLETIEEDARELIVDYGCEEVLARLRDRLLSPDQHSTLGKLTRGILREEGFKSPMDLPGDGFNLAAEGYYRNTLRIRHLLEGFGVMLEEVRAIEREDRYRDLMGPLTGREAPSAWLEAIRQDLVHEIADADTLRRTIRLTLAAILRASRVAGEPELDHQDADRAPVH